MEMETENKSLCTTAEHTCREPVRFSTVLTIQEWNSLSPTYSGGILSVSSDRNYNSTCSEPKIKRKMTNEEEAREVERKGKSWEERERKEAHATEGSSLGSDPGMWVTSLRLSLILLPPQF